MRIYYISDIHLEFYSHEEYLKGIPTVVPPNDSATSVLALCGDIGMVDKGSRRKQYLKFLKDVSKSFKHVIVIRGNHEAYKYSFDKTPKTIREIIKDNNLNNITLLDNEFLELEGILIYGSPFFTNFSNDPLAEWSVNRYYNDFKQIRNNNHTSKLSTLDYIKFYEASVSHCKSLTPDVVLSHYLPSLKLLEYTTGLNDKGMGGEPLEELILEGISTKIWIYGHDHSRKETNLGDTLCVSNCFGYYSSEHFKKEITFDKFVDV